MVLTATSRFGFSIQRVIHTHQFSARSRSITSLAVLEQRDGCLSNGSLTAISAARKLGGSIHGFVAGTKADVAAEQASKIAGLEKVIAVKNKAYERGLSETFAPLLVQNIKNGGYTHAFAAHSSFGKDVMPRVAALLDMQQVSDIVAVENETTFVRPIYAGNAIATVEAADAIKLVTVRGAAFPFLPQTEAEDGQSEAIASIVDGVDPGADHCPTDWLSEELSTSERPDLASASRVVSGGRALKSKDEFDRLLLPLADALGAAVGASRAAVDSGFCDNSLQIGQTGKVVAPQLYVAVGISGAIQHLAGMKDSKIIVALNKDPDAPIFQLADIGLVGDIFKTVPALTEKLKTTAK